MCSHWKPQLHWQTCFPMDWNREGKDSSGSLLQAGFRSAYPSVGPETWWKGQVASVYRRIASARQGWSTNLPAPECVHRARTARSADRTSSWSPLCAIKSDACSRKEAWQGVECRLGPWTGLLARLTPWKDLITLLATPGFSDCACRKARFPGTAP